MGEHNELIEFSHSNLDRCLQWFKRAHILNMSSKGLLAFTSANHYPI